MDFTQAELLSRCERLAGFSFAELADLLQMPLPATTTQGKGWIGQLIERALGAYAASKPIPDFPHLGIELKTLPVNAKGLPSESTFVCSIPLMTIKHERFETSTVYHKLKRVLWFPIEADKSIPFAKRRLGNALLWSPQEEELAVLRTDWEEAVDMIARGEFAKITAHFGQVLQVRPKGASAKSLTEAIDEDGQRVKTMPRGFYLRPDFTHKILQQHYSLTV